MLPRWHVDETPCSCTFTPTLHVTHLRGPILTPLNNPTAVRTPDGRTCFVQPSLSFSLKWRLRQGLVILLGSKRIKVEVRCARVYAVTGRKKLLGGALCVPITAQICFGIYFVILTASSPCKFLNRLFVHLWSYPDF